MQQVLKVWLGIVMTFYATLLVMTSYEYYRFRTHAIRLHVLHDDYRAYLMHLSELARPYEEPGDDHVSQEAQQEKAESIQESDDDDDNDSESSDEDEFIVVNRSADYLRESAMKFYVHHNLHGSLDNLADAWEPYNDWHVKQRAAKPLVSRKKAQKKSTRSRAKRVQKTVLSKSRVGVARFAWPIDPAHFWLSSLYGPRKRKDGLPGFHHGLDMAAVKGTRINAAASGKVVEARYTAGWGNTILIDHQDGRYKTRYAHLDKIHVYAGQQVTRDTWIGNVGDTGRVRKKGKDASHLHFEVYDRGKRINPLPLLG